MSRKGFQSRIIGLVFLGAAIAASGAASPAAAASAPPVNWAGFYVGGNVGLGWGHYDYSVTGLGPSWGGVVPAFIKSNGSPDLEKHGLTGGFQAGINFQHGRVVWGAESDFSWMALKDSYYVSKTNPANVGVDDIFEVKSSVKWLATMRPRLGWLVTDKFLTYLTGGLAFGQVNSSWTLTARANAFGIPAPDDVYAASSSGVRTGWALGGGVEYALKRNWTLRLDYLHVDLGTENFRTSTPAGQAATHYIDVSAKTRLDFVRLGANYKF